MSKIGRPTVYKIDYPEKLLKAMKCGKSVERFCKQIDIAKSMFYRWVKEYPELQDAFEKGKCHCEAHWERWLVKNLTNKDVNTGLVKLFMTNRFNWTTEKKEQYHDVSVNETTKKLIDADEKYKKSF